MRYKVLLLAIGAVLLSLACCVSGECCDDDMPVVPGIRLPMQSVSVESSAEQVVETLPADTLWVVESTRELLVLSSPAGLVSITSDSGPMKVMAKFADGEDKIELRTFDSPYLYFVQAVGQGKTEILIVPVGVSSEAEITRQMLTVSGPRPPPEPIDPVDPIDPIDPPAPVKSFRVIFVKESGDTLNPQQTAIPGAKQIRDYLNSKTTPEGGTTGWREYDPQQTTANEQPTMRDLWAAVKPQLLPSPCMVVEINGHATVMPFPADVADCMATLKKAGGD